MQPVLLLRPRLPRPGVRGLRARSGRAARPRGTAAARLLQGREGRAQGPDRLRRQAAATGHAATTACGTRGPANGTPRARTSGRWCSTTSSAAIARGSRQTAYPYIRRGAHVAGQLAAQAHGGSEGSRTIRATASSSRAPWRCMEVGKGMHMYYLNAFAHPWAARSGRRGRGRSGAEDDARLFAAEVPGSEAVPAPVVRADVQADGPLRGAPLVRRRAGGGGDVRLLGPQLPAVALPLHRPARPDARRPPGGAWSA